jgi:uncharacterized iron-regulated membrane protein
MSRSEGSKTHLPAIGRQLWVRLHRYIGLATALFLAVASLTGSIIVFMPELDAWLNPRLFRAAYSGAVLPIDSLVMKFERVHPALTVSSIRLPPAPGMSAYVFVTPRPGQPPPSDDQYFLDPASGRVLGTRAYGAARLDAAHILPFLRRVHYSLHIPGVWGIWLMGYVALAWTLDCLIAFYLTLPRGRPFWRKWRPSWRLKAGAGSYRINLDLHRASGLWFWPVLALLALTSVALNLPDQIYRPILSAVLPTTPTLWERPTSARTSPFKIGFGEALRSARLEADRLGWERATPDIAFAMPDRTLYLVQFSTNQKAGFGASDMWIDARTAAIIKAHRAGSDNAGDIVDDLVLPIHTGQVAGLAGRIVIFIAGLVIFILAVTGIYIWWRKRMPRVARRRQCSQTASSVPEAESIFWR